MNNIINLIVGDWSRDGHEKTSEYVFTSNFNQEELSLAFLKGSEKVGFKLTDLCEEYEDNVISEDIANALTKLGLTIDSLSWSIEGESITIGADEYAKAYMLIAKLGNEEFIYEELKMDNITIGGYGLFY